MPFQVVELRLDAEDQVIDRRAISAFADMGRPASSERNGCLGAGGPQIREMLGLVATMDFGWRSGCLYSREGFDDRVLVGCSCRHQPRISGF